MTRPAVFVGAAGRSSAASAASLYPEIQQVYVAMKIGDSPAGSWTTVLRQSLRL
jgi:hypothetical protein